MPFLVSAAHWPAHGPDLHGASLITLAETLFTHEATRVMEVSLGEAGQPTLPPTLTHLGFCRSLGQLQPDSLVSSSPTSHFTLEGPG